MKRPFKIFGTPLNNETVTSLAYVKGGNKGLGHRKLTQ
jgi:hypothetical protein